MAEKKFCEQSSYVFVREVHSLSRLNMQLSSQVQVQQTSSIFKITAASNPGVFNRPGLEARYNGAWDTPYNTHIRREVKPAHARWYL